MSRLLDSPTRPLRGTTQRVWRDSSGGAAVNKKTVAGLVLGALVMGLLVGWALSGDKKATPGAEPGPSSVESGVPVGYMRSPEGATQAALNYSDALAHALKRPAAERRAVIQAMASSGKAEEIFGQLQDAYRLVDEALGSEADNAVASYGVLGYQVQAFDRESAEIALWEVSVFGSAATAKADAGWSTTIVKLRWTDGDWKLDSTPVGAVGPTPALRGTPSEAVDLITSAQKFSDVRHASS